MGVTILARSRFSSRGKGGGASHNNKDYETILWRSLYSYTQAPAKTGDQDHV